MQSDRSSSGCDRPAQPAKSALDGDEAGWRIAADLVRAMGADGYECELRDQTPH